MREITPTGLIVTLGCLTLALFICLKNSFNLLPEQISLLYLSLMLSLILGSQMLYLILVSEIDKARKWIQLAILALILVFLINADLSLFLMVLPIQLIVIIKTFVMISLYEYYKSIYDLEEINRKLLFLFLSSVLLSQFMPYIQMNR